MRHDLAHPPRAYAETVTASDFLHTATQLQRSSDQVHCVLDGNIVIMTLADGKYFELNRVGAHIWAQLEQPASISEIVDQLAAQYEVDIDTCRAEVETWLSRMHELGLVVAAPA